MTPAEFIEKWKVNTLSERAGAQQHFLDLCELLGVAKPDDPDNYCFERGAKRTGAGRGWSDVWKRGCFAWEYKAPKARLDTALKQLMTYALALDNPPLLVVSDRLRIEMHTHFTGTPSEVHSIALEDLGTPENLQKLRLLFSDPDQFKPKRTRTAITKQAAALFGDLALSLQQRGHDPQKVAHFLNKILFCLFAEDSAWPGSDPLLPDRLFSRILANGRKDHKRCEKQLKNLFGAMADRHGEFGEHLIQWFNGGLFDDDSIIPLTADDILKLENVALLDWSAIEPSIFGTLFERGLDPAKRAQLGAHYTDPVSIMRIVNPVIVEPLLAEWAAIKNRVAPLMQTVEALHNSSKPAEKSKATTAFREANKLYIGFLERLKHFKVLDPACGSGNFLYLALQSLKDIELRVMLEAEALDLERGFPGVGPQCVAGIEISPYAAELARVTVWIGDIQWMLKHGFAPSKEPILKTLDQIQCRDALLALVPTESDSARFVETAWPQTDAIIGNPPFLGDRKMIRELGERYTFGLRATFEGRVPGGADLVCYWFEKGREAIESGKATRVGLVATNSIRGGANRQVIDRISDTTELYEVWSDEPWVNEGAAVRVSLICFGKESRSTKLDNRRVSRILSDLTSVDLASVAVDLTKAQRLRECAGASFIGTQKNGPFDVDGDVARKWLDQPNPDGRKNADIVRPWANGLDITRRGSGKWIIDFGTSSTEQECPSGKAA